MTDGKGRNIRILMRLAAGAALLGSLYATAAVSADAPADPRRKGVEQKLKLVETVLNGNKTKQVLAGDNADAKAQVAKAQQLLESARKALGESDIDQAGAALDQALRSVTAATSQSGTINLSAERARNTELLEQLKSYRASLVDARKDPKSGAAAGAAIDKLDRTVAEADKLAAQNNFQGANKLLGEAYLAAVQSLSSLREGQTVLLSLKFDTPADEFAYEDKRNKSHEMMVDMMVAEGKAEGGSKALIDRFLEEHRRLRLQAEKEAKGGNYPTAIKSMEQATGQLVRALQTLGVPVF